MSNLQQLINDLCPDGVEFVKLGDVCEILDSQRKPISKGNRKAGSYPYYGANGIQDYVEDFIFDGTFILMGEDGSVINKDNSPVLNWATGKIWVNNHAHILAEKPGANLRFLYYILGIVDVSKIVRGTPPKLNQKNLRDIDIPLPPLPVQQEIVRILDKFTELEAELEAELDCRKRQYQHYRDRLLAFNNNDQVEWKTLSEITFYPKERVQASALNVNNYVGVENLLKDRQGKIPASSVPEGAAIKFAKDDILIGNIRPYLRKIWRADCSGGTNGDVLCFRIKEEAASEIVPEYLYQILSSEDFFNYDISKSRGAKMPRGDKSAVMQYRIPLPPLEDQRRIADILDRFEQLTTDLQAGLPAEIDARRRQYEHYRDQLLTFKQAQSPQPQ